MTMKDTLNVGDKVICNGNRGVVARVLDGKLKGLVEVRLIRGVVCVDISDLRRVAK